MNYFRLFLVPFSLLYGIAVAVRNRLFDHGILKSKKFDVPIISVGNITVGGTGKTPHIEYLAQLLQKKFRVGVVSRGYKRKTKGFVLAGKKSTPSDIGDEPFQVYKKFDKIALAVSENRVEGISKLLKKKKKTRAVLLDDAFQHRYVLPGLSIVLIDYNRPVFSDFLLPAGNLREGISALKRAQVVIVTKSPKTLTSNDTGFWQKRLRLLPSQHLFFSTMEYGSLEPVFGKKHLYKNPGQLKRHNVQVLLVTGIANPRPIEGYLSGFGIGCQLVRFPDHHNFTRADIDKIRKQFSGLKAEQKIILTTEKDAVRMIHLQGFPKKIKPFCYYLPVKVKFANDTAEQFNRLILDYVVSQ
ncbi:MAG: tetraacyldisaccharide 4'-kinase [Bacteroidales bacterium]|nr:tetraacyldisaccharide 4'-kinase [Bacteroidales bacterium]